MSNITKNLRKLRETKRLSEERLTGLTDVTNDTIIKIEVSKNQHPMLDTLKKITKPLVLIVDNLIK